MFRNIRFSYLPSILAFTFAATLALSVSTFAHGQSTSSSQAAPDNSANNKSHDTTADKQKENASDRSITQNIRKAIMADKSLSTYAHNVKIITVNGAVTLTGPVNSEDEKKRVEELANGVLKGSGTVTNNITVKS
jgi:osmotically-inducible protein OsmY